MLLDAKTLNLISDDGVRLLARHPKGFLWNRAAPPEVPHHHPLADRLQRTSEVDVGPPVNLPRYVPVDYDQQPERVRSLDDAVAALRWCDKLCCLVAVQSHCVKNSANQIAALITRTFTELLPLPRPAGDDAAPCVWREPMLYKTQLDILLLLQRLVERFAAAAFSLHLSRAFDGARLVVPACIAVVADATLRAPATDIAPDHCTLSTVLVGGSVTAAKGSKRGASGFGLPHVLRSFSSAPASDHHDQKSQLVLAVGRHYLRRASNGLSDTSP